MRERKCITHRLRFCCEFEGEWKEKLGKKEKGASGRNTSLQR